MKLNSKHAREIALVALVALAAVLANLPEEILDRFGVERDFLLGLLALTVFIALFLYLKFQFFFLVVLLPTGLEPKPKEQSAEGIKVLFYAIEKGNLVYAQKLLSQNFDPNLVADNGYTPLMYAAARGDPKMVELLLRNGANVNIVSDDGDTAIELALRIGSQECADILKKARADQLAREQAAQPKQV